MPFYSCDARDLNKFEMYYLLIECTAKRFYAQLVVGHCANASIVRCDVKALNDIVNYAFYNVNTFTGTFVLGYSLAF